MIFGTVEHFFIFGSVVRTLGLLNVTLWGLKIANLTNLGALLTRDLFRNRRYKAPQIFQADLRQNKIDFLVAMWRNEIDYLEIIWR